MNDKVFIKVYSVLLIFTYIALTLYLAIKIYHGLKVYSWFILWTTSIVGFSANYWNFKEKIKSNKNSNQLGKGYYQVVAITLFTIFIILSVFAFSDLNNQMSLSGSIPEPISQTLDSRLRGNDGVGRVV